MARACLDAPTVASLTFFLGCSCGRNHLGLTQMVCCSPHMCSTVPGTEKMFKEASPQEA